MNNLLKMSTLLNGNDFLQELLYKAKKENIIPIRYLFYFCVEKIFFDLYIRNGSKMRNKKFLKAKNLKE